MKLKACAFSKVFLVNWHYNVVNNVVVNVLLYNIVEIYLDTKGCLFSITFVDTDIHEYVSSPCQNGGHCTDSVNGYPCACFNGYFDFDCVKSKYRCCICFGLAYPTVPRLRNFAEKTVCWLRLRF